MSSKSPDESNIIDYDRERLKRAARSIKVQSFKETSAGNVQRCTGLSIQSSEALTDFLKSYEASEQHQFDYYNYKIKCNKMIIEAKQLENKMCEEAIDAKAYVLVKHRTIVKYLMGLEEWDETVPQKLDEKADIHLENIKAYQKELSVLIKDAETYGAHALAHKEQAQRQHEASKAYLKDFERLRRESA